MPPNVWHFPLGFCSMLTWLHHIISADLSAECQMSLLSPASAEIQIHQTRLHFSGFSWPVGESATTAAFLRPFSSDLSHKQSVSICRHVTHWDYLVFGLILIKKHLRRWIINTQRTQYCPEMNRMCVNGWMAIDCTVKRFVVKTKKALYKYRPFTISTQLKFS